MTNSRHQKLWKYVNRCVVCGTKLQFMRSARADTEPEEGVMYCQRNHESFTVYGRFDAHGEWRLDYHLPQPGKRL